jgi:hypothetical protein
MENQVNIGDKNAQQIGQNPINQSVQIPKKSKVNYWVVSTIFLTVVVLLGGLYTSKLVGEVSLKERQTPDTITPTQTIQPSPTEKPLPASPAVNDQQLKTYDGKFISFRYPSNLYIWSYGRGVSLDYFQINSISQADEQNPDKVIIAFDIQIPGYTEGQTLEEQKKRIESFQNQYPDTKYVIAEQKIDGIDVLVYERTIANSPSYEKTVWVRKNNVKYIITMTVFSESQQKRDLLVNQYKQDFENILNSIKLKYVDPTEVEKLGNHPD